MSLPFGCFIFHHAGLLVVIVALAAGMFVMGCFGPLIAVYVREDLHAATGIFGVASVLIGVGLLVGINALGTFEADDHGGPLGPRGTGRKLQGIHARGISPGSTKTFVQNAETPVEVVGHFEDRRSPCRGDECQTVPLPR